MARFVVHDMETAWPSSDVAALSTEVEAMAPGGRSVPGNLLVATAGGADAFARFLPSSPLDLSPFEELRFWLQADRVADGSVHHPFFLELSFDDANDAAGEIHCWQIPVNRAGHWEQRRIGIEGERRGAVNAVRFRRRGAAAFNARIAGLLAVREEMLVDLECALEEAIGVFELQGLTGVPLDAGAAAGDNRLELGYSPGFHPGNRIRVDAGGGGVTLERELTAVEHDREAGTTSLVLAEELDQPLGAGSARVTLRVPVVFEAPPAATVHPIPAIVATLLDFREDPLRSSPVTQRDSFQQRDGRTSCATRPAAIAYQVDYQLTVVAPERLQQARIQDLLSSRISMDRGLLLNGAPAPLALLPPPEPDSDGRRLGLLAPLYLRIGTRRETAARQRLSWPDSSRITVAHRDAPQDRESIGLGP